MNDSNQIKNIFSDTIQLNGHKTEVYCGKFSSNGELFASAGGDKIINIWQTFHPQCQNITTFQNAHSNTILELSWGKDNSLLYSCSVDKTIKIWDIYESKLQRKIKDHDNFINSLDVYEDKLIASVGENCSLILNDSRAKEKIHQEKMKYQLTTVKFTRDGDEIYFGGIDNQIKKFSVKKNKISDDVLIGHLDTITGISISHNNNYLLSNSADKTLRVWDIKPYVRGGNRLVKVLKGNSHNFEKNLLRCTWNNKDTLVSCGSADRCVHIWDVETEEIKYNLYGHMGSVNEVDFNICNDTIISSVSSDHSVIIGKFC